MFGWPLVLSAYQFSRLRFTLIEIKLRAWLLWPLRLDYLLYNAVHNLMKQNRHCEALTSSPHDLYLRQVSILLKLKNIFSVSFCGGILRRKPSRVLLVTLILLV